MSVPERLFGFFNYLCPIVLVACSVSVTFRKRKLSWALIAQLKKILVNIFDPVARNSIKQDIQRILKIKSQLSLQVIDTFGGDGSLGTGRSNFVHNTYQSKAPRQSFTKHKLLPQIISICHYLYYLVCYYPSKYWIEAIWMVIKLQYLAYSWMCNFPLYVYLIDPITLSKVEGQVSLTFSRLVQLNCLAKCESN